MALLLFGVCALQVTKTVTSRTVKQSGSAPVTTTTTVVSTDNGNVEDIDDEEILKKLVRIQCSYAGRGSGLVNVS